MKKTDTNLTKKIATKFHDVDFCIVGGGLAGMCAAIAAARDGSKVLLMHDRPMLGGNASSEIRMWICGAGGSNNRETGLVEEIQLESLYRNPDKNYFIWDSILFEKVRFEPNITMLLNCSCYDAQTDKDNITSVTGWQTTTQEKHTVRAKYFADCSGDSILAPLTGAEYRFGRESREETGEQMALPVADSKTMGMSCLIQGRLSERKTKFTPPAWATKMTPEMIANRKPKMNQSKENFWYLELGGDKDSIADTESVRDELLALAYGMWDYIKNSGEIENADYWHLDFLGILPGKRESRRMVGKYMMTSTDILNGGIFEDNIAFGGWPLDDHHPGGFNHVGIANTFDPTPSPYGIPYRCLYSNNIQNLFFAGRNISMTHAAMSSTRVMATCALLGEAVGTAANIAREFSLTPDGVYLEKIKLLQERLMYKDCFIPRLRRTVNENVLSAHLSADSNPPNINNLRNGVDRDNHTYGEEEQSCLFRRNENIKYTLKTPKLIDEVRITFDSDLDRTTLPGDKTERTRSMRANIFLDSPSTHPPLTLVREFKLYATLENGETTEIAHIKDNRKRTVFLPVGKRVSEIWLQPVSTWGNSDEIRIFSFDFS